MELQRIRISATLQEWMTREPQRDGRGYARSQLDDLIHWVVYATSMPRTTLSRILDLPYHTELSRIGKLNNATKHTHLVAFAAVLEQQFGESISVDDLDVLNKTLSRQGEPLWHAAANVLRESWLKKHPVMEKEA